MSHPIYSEISSLPIGTKRFDKGPYFNIYHKENNKGINFDRDEITKYCYKIYRTDTSNYFKS